MRNQNFIPFCLSVICLTLMYSPALAQEKKASPPNTPVTPPANPLLTQPTAPKPVRIFTYTVIPFETLEPSLQLTPDQSVKVKSAYDHFDAESATLRAAAQTPEEKNALNGKIRALQLEANTQIDAALSETQKKKATGLIFEMAQMISVGISPQMLRVLKLTPDQRVQILKIESVVQEKAKTLVRSEYRTKYPAIMEVERAKILPLLTPAQKLIFDRYDTQGKLITAAKPSAPVPPATAKTGASPAPPAPNTPSPEKK